MTGIPLPDKRVCRLNAREMAAFRKSVGLDGGGDVVPYPTPEEAAYRRKRERWKRRYAGKGSPEPCLLIREEQILTAKANARRHRAARRWRDDLLDQADLVSGLPAGFFTGFIPDTGPWNTGGNFCPNCVHRKSPESINRYFWKWDWRDPDRLVCPYCGISYPHAEYPENGVLELPRTGKTYTFHILPAELETGDWRAGASAARYVNQPIHVSFTGNSRALRIQWALRQLEPLGLAFAFTGRRSYARTAERILLRMADVYPGYLLQSYFQDFVDADPGYATDHVDALPTVFKRNACIGAYDGRYGYDQDRTTTQTTRVATGLWGCGRIAYDLSSTGGAFLRALESYDLVKVAIDPEIRRRIEQDFLLELYLDVRAYGPITNKAGAVRTSRVAFGLAYLCPRKPPGRR